MFKTMKNCLGEKELIHLFLTELPASAYMQNHFFESDAEVLSGPSGKLLFTTDEFSDEDHLILLKCGNCRVQVLQ